MGKEPASCRFFQSLSIQASSSSHNMPSAQKMFTAIPVTWRHRGPISSIPGGDTGDWCGRGLIRYQMCCNWYLHYPPHSNLGFSINSNTLSLLASRVDWWVLSRFVYIIQVCKERVFSHHLMAFDQWVINYFSVFGNLPRSQMFVLGNLPAS